MSRIILNIKIFQRVIRFSPRIFLWGAVFMLGIFTIGSDARAANELNSLSYFVGSNSGTVTANNAVEDDANSTGFKNFTFFIGDEASLVKGLFFEISGVSADAGGNNRINVSIDDASFSSGRQKQFTINSNGRQTPFKFIYDDSTDYIDGHIASTSVGRGTYGPYTLNIKTLDAGVSLWSARLIIVYRHKPPGTGGGLPAIGYYESPIFDSMQTGETSGIKSGFHNLNWTETNTGSQRVKFQIASCDSVTGTACNDAGGWVYRGRDGGTATYYGFYESNFSDYCSGSSGTYNCRISFDHYNKRYFRYKITLCSASDCSTSGAAPSPGVNKVILNWSP